MTSHAPTDRQDRQAIIATNVTTIYAELISTTTVAKINSLPQDVAEEMALEVELQMQKMMSLKALLEVRVREARKEEERRRSGTVNEAWSELGKLQSFRSGIANGGRG